MPNRMATMWYKHTERLWPTVAAVGLLTASWALVGRRLWQIGDMSTQVPLHYNIYFGVDAIGSAWQLLLSPGFATLVLGVNFGVMAWQSRDVTERPLQLILAITAMLVGLFALVGTLFSLAIPY